MAILKHWLGATVLALAAVAPAAAMGVPGPLVTPQWLHDHIGQVTVLTIADGDQTRLFTTAPKLGTNGAVDNVGGHVPGSLLVDFETIRQTRVEDGKRLQAMLPTPVFFTAAMDQAGLDAGKPIVIVPLGEGVITMDMGTRLFFQLRYFGEPADQVALLNGGTGAWLHAGYATSTSPAPTAPGNWKATKLDASILATLEQVKSALRTGSDQFVDARPTPQFLGLETPGIDKSAGHLPGALSFPTDAIARTHDGVTTFMTPRDYAWIFATYGISATRPTITYCNTGHLASGAWFVVHEILGNKQSRLYANSMNEWTNLGNPTVALPE